MDRIYDGGQRHDVDFFVGTEIEHTPAHGLKTLFVVGIKDADLIDRHAREHQCEHIYLGANQSFDPDVWANGPSTAGNDWDRMIKSVLRLGYLTTLDFDAKHTEWVCEGGYAENNLFIPQISVKIPYIGLLGYNATLKLDDKGFDKTNPGVWCHGLHELQDRSRFTPWTEYKKDMPL